MDVGVNIDDWIALVPLGRRERSVVSSWEIVAWMLLAGSFLIAMWKAKSTGVLIVMARLWSDQVLVEGDADLRLYVPSWFEA